MKFVSRRTALALSATFCGAAAFGATDALVTRPSEPPTRGVAHEPRSTSAFPPEPATGAPATTEVAPTPLLTAATLPKRGGVSLKSYRDGSYTGPAVDAYYGLLRVRVDVRGGRITSIHVLQYPSDNPTSRYINSQALPMLESEVIQAQDAFVYMVSGATLSSNAFLHSTYSALRQARG